MKKIILITMAFLNFVYSDYINYNDLKKINKKCSLYTNGKLVTLNKKTKIDEINYIDCSNKKLKKIDKNIYKLKKIKILDFSNNEIKEIPNKILKMRIDVLNLYNNPIRAKNIKSNTINRIILTKKDNDIYNDEILKTFTKKDIERYNNFLKKYRGITWFDLDYYNMHTNKNDKVANLALKKLKIKKLLNLRKINVFREQYLYKKYANVCLYKILRYYDSAYARLDYDETKAFGQIIHDRKTFNLKKYNFYLQKYRDLSKYQLNYKLRTQKCIMDISALKAIKTLLN